MKRASEKQLTQLSAAQSDDEENGDDAQGTWKAAPPEVLAQRRIVKVGGTPHAPESCARLASRACTTLGLRRSRM